jgi:hypothetical protein
MTYTQWQPRRRRRRNPWGPIFGVLLVVAILIAAGAIATNAFGLGERWENLVDRVALIVDPPPDKSIPPEALFTDPPAATPTPIATAAPPSSGSQKPGRTQRPSPTPTPLPARTPIDLKLPFKPATAEVTQLTNDWCAVAATQVVLAADGLTDNSDATQREIASRIDEWESRRDSHNGGWGPAAIAAALDAYGAKGYEVRVYQSRQSAMRDGARQLKITKAPVVIIAWRGAHAWVMTGFKADADPTIFPDATIEGAYIYDPWYPDWKSSIWKPSLGPGAFHDWENLQENFLPWQRPEGSYPGRDGNFILVVPTQPRPNL